VQLESGDVIRLNPDYDYQNKTAILYNGATVAHIMAREGHHFSDEEIQKLGDPKDQAGLKLADWMAKVEHPEPKIEPLRYNIER
jgi:hypothetical protein